MIEKQAIRDFLSTLTNKDIPISDDDSLLTTRLLDSLSLMQLVSFLESHFHVTFDSDELLPSNLDTIDAIVGFLERKGIS
jgi:acyl carrier protein